MFNIGIKKELDRKREKSISNSDTFQGEAQKLIETHDTKEKDALRRAGLDYQVKKIEGNVGVEIERQQIEEEYGNDTFTEQEIKEICVKYDLRFLRTDYFQGSLDSKVSKKLKVFLEEHPEIGDRSDSFFIIAPSKAFNLQDNEKKPLFQLHPILVYQIPKQDDKYVYIHKWGFDFTFMRRLRGMFFESTMNMWTMTGMFWILAVSAIFSYIFKGFTGEWFQYFNLLWITPLSFLLSYGTLRVMFNDIQYFNKRITEKIWNTDNERRK